MELNDAARALIGAGADATLVTINPDGSPQVSVVWVALQSTPDGDELVAAHLSGNYKKLRNIRRDPHVALTVLAPSQPGQQREYLAVTGSARVVEGGAPELLSQLAIALLGSDEHFPPPNSPEGYLTRIRVESVGGHGPWA
ncbi:PPOX class F420-dependent oxidoreductase [Mycobacteroides abscessus]|uniref:Pyridoxamine 5'-phosphate oxidase n=7 Tax=Mycobacteroides abscessus TaxID=36809 RepID=A0A1U2RF20_9MYCO|nr:PPOX class F420-dependent oxidoreductase [Mycobacteroides abscessus]ESV59621.1 PPOX class putative F420-dependent enzyme family protein [Mycobacteroides abscessus MAB_082312_2258]ESV64049.1 PPOX class putative F420-dependent enzyme family protein [Mycobacteroides abscessus MAB_091912_2446]AIC71972.1 oxidoreductase [Mycobacteroides abscessus subsp. massiliense str. GO 06]AMU26495.1 PPOX class F420-dependent enzyme [Mycobacteroides abscessus]AMU31553.1 PPOX class F420-dependent enzyme [Mycoba